MPQNPFPTRAEWKAFKDKHGVPDKIVSYSFGEKMDALHKKYDSAGLNSPGSSLTVAKAPAAHELVKEGQKLIKEYRDGLAKKVKSSAVSADLQKKINAKLDDFEKWFQTLKDVATRATDPFDGARKNYDKCLEQMLKAIHHPTEVALQNLYSQGMRNHLGASFHDAMSTYRGTSDVLSLLKAYNDRVSKWHSSMQGDGPKALAKDQAKTKEFLADMQEAMKIGGQILKLTKP